MRRKGFTLVELMVAIAIGLVLLAAVASITQQVQRSISTSTQREDAVRYARGVLNDIERDVANMVPAAQAPDPFAGNVLEIEATVPRGGANPDQDRLKVFTVLRVPSGELGRGFVEYTLRNVRPNPTGGAPIGELHRRIVEFTGPGDTSPQSTSADTNLDSILAENVAGMTVEWLDPAGVYQAPTAQTASGAAFALTGQLDIGQDPLGTRAKAAGGSAQAILDGTPIGGELLLITSASGTAPIRVLIRRRLGSDALLNERLPVMSGVDVQRFAGPAMIRVTITFIFGRGADAQTARFSKTIAIHG